MSHFEKNSECNTYAKYGVTEAYDMIIWGGIDGLKYHHSLGIEQNVVVCWLLNFPTTSKLHLRDGSAQTI